MASYGWEKDSGGNWSDPGSWHPPGDDDPSIPGAGDDVSIYVEGTVTTDGTVSVNSVRLGFSDTIISGGLTASTVDGSGVLNGGKFNITTMSGTTFAGGMLTATTIELNSTISGGTVKVSTLDGSAVTGGDVSVDNADDVTLSGGTVDAGTLTDSRISGADVTADHFSGNIGVSDGSLDTSAIVLEDDQAMITTGGIVTADTLTMTDGPSDQLELAVFAGTVTISGAASFTGSRGIMQVGHNNEGSSDFYTGGKLNLEGGFTLKALDNRSGNALQTWAGATTTIDGAVLVDMTNGISGGTGLLVTGGTMDITGTTTLGQTAQGRMQVTEGGTVQIDKVQAGVQKGSSGNIYVDGAGSTLTATDEVTVGVAGQGSLQVNAAAATLDTLVLGADKGGDGLAAVFGKDATLSVKHSVSVGEKGTGALSVTASFDADDVVVAGKGSPIDKKGNGEVDPDTGLHLLFGGTMAVGTNATATLGSLTLGEYGYAWGSVDGGTLTVKGESIVAKEQGSEGQISVHNGLWDAQGGLTVASAGKARVEVDSGGTLTVSGDTTLAEEEGSDAHGLINSGLWEAGGSLTVGAAGKALIDVGAGGTLQADSDVTLGDEKGGSGQIVIGDGSAGNGPGTLTVGGDLTIGGGGSGTLLSDLSTVTMNGGKITLGDEKGSKGTLTLHGGTLTTGGEIVAGEGGSGTITFNQGAKLKEASGNHTPDLTLGEKFGATGTVTFDGKGTTATVADIEDGVLGKGTLKITGGAKLTASSADVAANVNSNANGVTVDSAATFVVTGDLSVGEKGFGTLTVKGAGQAMVSGEVAIAGDAASIGSATISATAAKNGKTTASSLSYGTLVVGEGGSGTLIINKGADVDQIKGGEGSVEIGAEKGATGALTLTDKGSVLAGKSLAVGGTDEAAGGKGSLSVSADATATFDSAAIWKSGSVTLSGGTLHVTGDIDGNGTITIGKAGTLMLDGDDDTVGISFAKGSKGASLMLGGADLLHAAVKGFAAGDSIVIDGLDKHAAISVATKGANTVVTIKDGGKELGSLTLAGHFGKSSLDLSATGVLTVKGEKSAAHADAASQDASRSGHAGDSISHVHDHFVFDVKSGTGNVASGSDALTGIEPSNLGRHDLLSGEDFVGNEYAGLDDSGGTLHHALGGDELAHATHFASFAA